jgi:glutathione S-transferase
MSDKITFYYNPMSRARIVHWMLEEVQADYEIKLLRFDQREHKSPNFLQINPMGKVPAIVHRGVVITESAAICAYLADLYPEAKLAPRPDDPRRGTYLRWLFFGASCVEPALVDKLFGRPDPEPGALGYGNYDDTMNALESALRPSPFILGDMFSAVDVYLSSEIWWGMMVKAIEPKPGFDHYVQRCSERDAYKRYSKQANEIAESMRK